MCGHSWTTVQCTYHHLLRADRVTLFRLWSGHTRMRAHLHKKKPMPMRHRSHDQRTSSVVLPTGARNLVSVRRVCTQVQYQFVVPVALPHSRCPHKNHVAWPDRPRDQKSFNCSLIRGTAKNCSFICEGNQSRPSSYWWRKGRRSWTRHLHLTWPDLTWLVNAWGPLGPVRCSSVVVLTWTKRCPCVIGKSSLPIL
jgi:hypothetical protein